METKEFELIMAKLESIEQNQAVTNERITQVEESLNNRITQVEEKLHKRRNQGLKKRSI